MSDDKVCVLKLIDIQKRQRLDPIERFADAGRFFQIQFAYAVQQINHLAGQLIADAGNFELDNFQFAL